jgi:TRAP-type transport system periplasmic protein
VTIEINVSHYMPEDHGTHVDFIAPWARALEAESNGVLRVIVHSGASVLGVLNNQYAQVSSGAVDVAHCVASLPPDRFPRTSIIGMPFLATGAGEATRMLWHLFPRYLREEYHGLHVLALHADSGGLLHTREGPLRRLEDLAGLRIRTPNPVIGDALTQLGAAPVPLAPREIKEALLSGVIDGAAMAWDVLDYSQTADLLRFHLNTKLYVSPLYFVMNEARYQRLEPALRAAVDSVSGDRLVARFDRWWGTWEQPGIDAARQRGNSITRLDEDELTRWRNAVKPAITRQLHRLDAQGVANVSEIYERALEIRQTMG